MAVWDDMMELVSNHVMERVCELEEQEIWEVIL